MTHYNSLTNPLISVIMPVYNADQFVGEAIESILSQTFDDFEFLIIDDCSEDSSSQIISRYNDPRIRLLKNQKNIGVARTLNKGLSLARGRYVARMDADDVSIAKRFSRQFEHMERFPDVDICGSWVWHFTGKKKFLLKFPVGRECVGSFLLLGNPLAHPAIMMRKDVLHKLDLQYDHDCLAAQDYELWSRCWGHCTMDNIPEPLMAWRQNLTGVTHSLTVESNKTSLRVVKKMLGKLEVQADETKLLFHRKVGNGSGVASLEELTEVFDWLTYLIQVNQQQRVFPDEGLKQAAAFAWYRVCLNSSGIGVKTIFKYMQSSLCRYYRPGSEEMLYFISNAILKFNKSPTGTLSFEK